MGENAQRMKKLKMDALGLIYYETYFLVAVRCLLYILMLDNWYIIDVRNIIFALGVFSKLKLEVFTRFTCISVQ